MNLTRTFTAGTFALLLLGPGCASVLSRRPHQETKPYPGVRGELQLLAHPKSVTKPPIHPAVVVSFCLLDLPLSAVLDTLLLSIDLTYRNAPTGGNPCPR